uniref:Uncharacterized protein n=1 Tax=Mesocestoides corti TaxID=53468 RepID=A0A5K3F0J9_MESCO
MGRGRKICGDCIGANASLCKILSAFFMIAGIALIIAGGILIGTSKTQGRSFSFHDFDFDSDDIDEGQWKFSLGAALLVCGVALFVVGLLTMCCAFQLGFCRRLIHSKYDDQQTETQNASQRDRGLESGTKPQPPRPQQPSQPQQPTFVAPYPPNTQNVQPPSYLEATSMPTAPQPLNNDLPEKQ